MTSGYAYKKEKYKKIMIVKIMKLYNFAELTLLIGYILNDIICRALLEEIKMKEMLLEKITMALNEGRIKNAVEKMRKLIKENKINVFYLNIFRFPLNFIYTARIETVQILILIDFLMEDEVFEYDVENSGNPMFKKIWRNYNSAINWLLSSDFNDEQPRYVTSTLLYINYAYVKSNASKILPASSHFC